MLVVRRRGSLHKSWSPASALAVLLAGFSACVGVRTTAVAPAPAVAWPESVTARPGDDAERIAAAATALANLRAAPKDEAAIIWYGRRLAYLGRYEDAVAVYSLGLTFHPDSPRLRRHRGHRYISLRRFAEAVADFDAARRRIAGSADEIEPDGQPNARNTPTSTLHTNIWYHLGLARYCRGEFDAAVECYRGCLAAAKNHDMEAATRYWLFHAATRAGDEVAAAAALAPVREDWDIIENHAYHQLLLLYRGDRGRDELKTPSGDAIQGATMAYGLARHRFVAGDPTAGREALAAIVANESAAFGCIAAEADLAR